MLIIDIGLFILYISILILAAELAVKTLTNIAGYLNISSYLIAFAFLAIATSIPELMVGINSAVSGNPSLTLGNVIGANILNLTLVLGIPILIAGGINTRSKEEKKDSLYMFIIVALLGTLMLIGNKIGRFDAILLLAAFGFYAYHTIAIRKEFHKKMHKRLTKKQGVINGFGLAASVPILHFSSQAAVGKASGVSESLGVPPIFIGLFIIAIGTTLPELMVALKAARKKQHDIIMGDVIGSVVTNSTLVIGIAALIKPIEANFLLFITSFGFMLLAAFLFSTFTESGNKLYQKEGVALIMLYVLFLIVELNIKGYF